MVLLIKCETAEGKKNMLLEMQMFPARNAFRLSPQLRDTADIRSTWIDVWWLVEKQRKKKAIEILLQRAKHYLPRLPRASLWAQHSWHHQ